MFYHNADGQSTRGNVPQVTRKAYITYLSPGVCVNFVLVLLWVSLIIISLNFCES